MPQPLHQQLGGQLVLVPDPAGAQQLGGQQVLVRGRPLCVVAVGDAGASSFP
jgi:hypothetical protein